MRRESLRDELARIPDLDRDSSDDPLAVLHGGAPVAEELQRPTERSREDRRPAADAGAGAGGTDAGSRSHAEPPPAGPPLAEGRTLRATVSRLLNGEVPGDAEVTASPGGGTSGPDAAGEHQAGADPLAPSDQPPAGGAVRSIDQVDDGRSAGDDAAGYLPVTPVGAPAAVGAPTGTGDVAARVGGDGASVTDLTPSGLHADAPEWLVAAAAVEEEASARAAARHRAGPRPRPPAWRRAGFAALVIVLLGAIPVLGRIGYQLVSESTDGRFTSSVKSPTDPGYETEVVSTPTMILLQTDADGRPVAATFLALSGLDGGGSVIFVPLETAVRTPAYGVDRISRAFDVLADRPADGRKQVAVQVSSLLNVGIDSVVEVDDRGWAQLVEPVAPLTVNNPDPLVTVDGVELPSGPLELSADQVGPYLAASREGEPAVNALVRHELVWEAWLSAIAESNRDDVVPGESSSGIGLFARSLADGPVTFSIVPTRPDPDHSVRLQPDTNALAAMVLAAVPSPDPASPGSRATVRLLNGVAPDPIPAGIIQTVVQAGGSVQVIGNGPSFGRDETTIVYSDPHWAGHAELLQVALGGGTVRHDTEAQDSVALTVILGSDVIDRADVTTTTAAVASGRDRGSSVGFSSGGDDFGDEIEDDATDSAPDPDSEVPE